MATYAGGTAEYGYFLNYSHSGVGTFTAYTVPSNTWAKVWIHNYTTSNGYIYSSGGTLSLYHTSWPATTAWPARSTSGAEDNYFILPEGSYFSLQDSAGTTALQATIIEYTSTLP